jgi:hypothetical protein
MRVAFRVIGVVAVSALHVGCKDSSISSNPNRPPEIVCGNWSSKVTAPGLWSKQTPPAVPSARRLHGVAYNTTTDRMIVFGGENAAATTSNDVWVLRNATATDGTATWMALTTSGTAPTPRSQASVVYDETNNILMVYAGAGTDDRFIDDFWVLSNADGNGGTAQWTKLSPTGSAPTVRFSPSAVYDPTSNSLALFGGIACDTSTCTQYDDVFVLANANGKGGVPMWSKRAIDGSSPTGRSHHTAVLDAVGAMIVFGGETSTALTLDPKGRVSDTWVLSNVFGKSGSASWKALAAESPPPGIAWHAAVYDPKTNRMTVFGGVDQDKYVRNRVFVLQNANGSGGAPKWGHMNVGTPEPDGRASDATYSPAKNRMMFFSGDIGDKKLGTDSWVLRQANGTASAPPAKVTVSASANRMCVGYKVQLVASAVDASGTLVEGGLITWKSNDPAICDVDADGWLSIHAKGNCEVQATLDGAISDPFTVLGDAPTPTSGGGTETWIVLRPDGAPATVTVEGGIIKQVPGKEWKILNAAGDCSFGVTLGGTVAGDKWQLTGDGSGCGGYHTACNGTGTSDGSHVKGSVTCDNDTPAGSISDTGDWSGSKQ